MEDKFYTTKFLITKYPCLVLHWLSFLILLAAIIYLLVSRIHAIKVLFDENVMSVVSLSDLSKDSISAKEKCYDCSNRNINRNIIRNNIVYSSYICIRNPLICMMFLYQFHYLLPKVKRIEYFFKQVLNSLLLNIYYSRRNLQFRNK